MPTVMVVHDDPRLRHLVEVVLRAGKKRSARRSAVGFADVGEPGLGQPGLGRLAPGLGWKNQRLDDDRHGAGGRDQVADVDEVELAQLDTVDRNDRAASSCISSRKCKPSSPPMSLSKTRISGWPLARVDCMRLDGARAERLDAAVGRRAFPMRGERPPGPSASSRSKRRSASLDHVDVTVSRRSRPRATGRRA